MFFRLKIPVSMVAAFLLFPGRTGAGTCAITGTGGWQTWATRTCAVTGATGVHDLYLKFTGGGVV